MIDFDSLVLAPCEAVFGQPVTYLSATGPAVETAGVFNDRFSDTTIGDGLQGHSTHPMVSVRASRLPKSPVQGELFRIRGILYQVTGVDPDGMGDLRVHLRLASDQQAFLTPR
jgi:hypothetical protein